MAHVNHSRCSLRSWMVLWLGIFCGACSPDKQRQDLPDAAVMDMAEAAVTSLRVDPSMANLEVGQKANLRAMAVRADASETDVTALAHWRVDGIASAIVNVDQDGTVTAIAPGPAMIWVDYQAFSGNTFALVMPPRPTSLAITPQTSTIIRTASQPYQALLTYSDGHSEDVTKQTTWRVMDVTGSGVASIDGNGLALGISDGTAQISAQLFSPGGFTAMATLVVRTPNIVSITVLPSSQKIAPQTVQQFKAGALFEDGVNRDVTSLVTWSAMDVTGSGVATIDATGLARSVATGRSTITASYSGKSGSATLDVSNATLSSITVMQPMASVPQGQKMSLQATGTFSDATTQEITTLATFSIADLVGTNVATITTAGEVSARIHGQARATATYLGVSGSTDVTVTQAWVLVVANDNMLHCSRAIWSIAANDVWAVGDEGVILHYNGSTWTKYTSNASDTLFAIWANGPNDVWVSGYTTTAAFASYPLVAHWDGSSWTRNVISSQNEVVMGLWGFGASNIWGATDSQRIYHNTGTGFEYQAGAGIFLYASDLWGSGPNDLWLTAGGGAMGAFDGTNWRLLNTGFSDSLSSIWGFGPGDFWAVGRGGRILRRQGGVFTNPTRPTMIDLWGVWGSTANDVWAVGGSMASGGMVHYDGTKWIAFPYPDGTAPRPLYNVHGLNKDDVWAIGVPGIYHWY